MIGNLQILRAFAASGVVILHSNATIFGAHTEFHGVALFFVLSGYLMSRICNRSAVTFALDRFWRIVPSYWLATALLLTILNMWTHWPVEHLVLSALFIPHQSPAGLYPVLGVGWTLNLEVYFYTIFTFSIVINRKFAPIIAGSIISAAYFGVSHFTDNEAALHYIAHKYIWFFVLGIGIWYFSEYLKNKDIKLNLPKMTLPVAIIAYAVLTVYFASKGYSVTVFYWSAIFSVSILFLIAILAADYGADLKPRAILLLGDASYACYLLHTILIEFLRHKGIASTGTFVFTTGVLIGSWSLAILWHLYIERFISMLPRRNVRISFQAS